MLGLRPYGNGGRDLFRMLDDMEREFLAPSLTVRSGRPSHAFRTDIKDCEDSFVLEAEMPGFDKSDISIELSGDILTVCAKREDKREESKDNYISRERRFGSYSRSFDVSNIDKEGITAEYNNGILELTLPKLKATEPETKKIELK